MSFAHKVVLWVMQRRGYLVSLKKGRIFFHTLFFCGKADFRSANLTSEVIFFNEILRVATSTNACKFVLLKSADVRGAGTRDEPLRTSAREARLVRNLKAGYEGSKSKFSLVLFAYNLMSGYSKTNRENYSRKCF